MSGYYDRYWEMQEGGPYNDDADSNKIFKCKDCGGETWHGKGWNGEPDTSQCADHCSSKTSDWKPGRVSRRFRENIARVRMSDRPLAATGKDVDPAKTAIKTFKGRFDSIFPNAPGAGL